jgi:colicin import membrane protein
MGGRCQKTDNLYIWTFLRIAPPRKTISQTDFTEEITMTSITSIKNIPTSTSLSPPKTPTAKSKDSKKQSKGKKTISQTDFTEEITMTSITSIKNIPTSTSLSPHTEKPIQSDKTTKFTSIININKAVSAFLSTHEGGLDVIIEDLSNSKEVYGVDPSTKLSKRQKMTKKVVQESVIHFIEKYAGVLEETPLGMPEEDISSLIQLLWKSYCTQYGFSDKLRETPVKRTGVSNKSAYMFFCEEHRSLLKDEQSTMSPNEILISHGKVWGTIKKNFPDEYERFTKLAEDNKVVDVVKEEAKAVKAKAKADREEAKAASDEEKEEAKAVKAKDKADREEAQDREKDEKIALKEEAKAAKAKAKADREEAQDREKDEKIALKEEAKAAKEEANVIKTEEKVAKYKAQARKDISDKADSIEKVQKANFVRDMKVQMIGQDDYDGESMAEKLNIIQGIWNDLPFEERFEYTEFYPSEEFLRIEGLNKTVKKLSPRENYLQITTIQFDNEIPGFSSLPKKEKRERALELWNIFSDEEKAVYKV